MTNKLYIFIVSIFCRCNLAWPSVRLLQFHSAATKMAPIKLVRYKKKNVRMSIYAVLYIKQKITTCISKFLAPIKTKPIRNDRIIS